MKYLAVTSCLMLLSGGCYYAGFSAGPGGELSASSNLAFEYGLDPPVPPDPPLKPGQHGPLVTPGGHDLMVTAGFLLIDNAVDTPFYESRPEMGGFVKLGLEVSPDTGLFVTVLGGLTFIHYAGYYDTDWQTDWNGLFGGGLTYFIDDKNFAVVTAYDNRRFFTAGVGWRF